MAQQPRKQQVVSYKTRHATVILLSNYTLEILSQRNEDLCSHKNCTNIFIDYLIYNNQKLESNPMPFTK